MTKKNSLLMRLDTLISSTLFIAKATLKAAMIINSAARGLFEQFGLSQMFITSANHHFPLSG